MQLSHLPGPVATCGNFSAKNGAFWGIERGQKTCDITKHRLVRLPVSMTSFPFFFADFPPIPATFLFKHPAKAQIECPHGRADCWKDQRSKCSLHDMEWHTKSLERTRHKATWRAQQRGRSWGFRHKNGSKDRRPAKHPHDMEHQWPDPSWLVTKMWWRLTQRSNKNSKVRLVRYCTKYLVFVRIFPCLSPPCHPNSNLPTTSTFLWRCEWCPAQSWLPTLQDQLFLEKCPFWGRRPATFRHSREFHRLFLRSLEMSLICSLWTRRTTNYSMQYDNWPSQDLRLLSILHGVMFPPVWVLATTLRIWVSPDFVSSFKILDICISYIGVS